MLEARTELSSPLGGSRRLAYRPFEAQRITEDRRWIHRPTVIPWAFPTPAATNQVIYWLGRANTYTSPLIAAAIPDYHLTGAGSGGDVFPRWRYEHVEDSGMLDLGGGDGEEVDGYRRVDNISDDVLGRFQSIYPGITITKDDIFFYVYGLLHSRAYRETYAADLKKSMPRVPLVTGFADFVHSGRRLSQLHLEYDSVEPYPLDGLDVEPSGDAYEFFAVGGKKMKFGQPKAEQKAAGERHDRGVIHYNDHITLRGIPLEAYRYMVGSRSAIEWIIDRYCVKTDKASGIVNDPNDWSREVEDPRYILDLLARIVTVSLETMKVVDALPDLDIIDKQ